MLLKIFLSVFIPSIAHGSLDKNLRYYDLLHADELQHKVVKRGLQESNHPLNVIKEVRFNTLGKDFRIFLTPKKGILHSKFKAYTVDGYGRETTVYIGNIIVEI